MFGLGMSEIIFLAVLALIVIGPKELPELARTLGRFLNELKRSSSIFTEDLKQHAKIDLLDLNPPAPKRPAPVILTDDEGVVNPVKTGMRFDLKPEPHQMEFSDVAATDSAESIEEKVKGSGPHE